MKNSEDENSLAKKILGVLSVLIVISMTIVAFTQNDTKKVDKTVNVTANKTTKASQSTGTSDTKQQEKKDESSKETAKDLPDVKSSDSDLKLVNSDHPVETDQVPLKSLDNGYLVADEVYQPYVDLAAAAQKDGIDLTVVSAYRSIEAQQQVYDQSIASDMSKGLSEEEAKKKTLEYVTVPGTSEHHTGYAIDVIDQPWYAAGNGLEEPFGDTEAGQWLATHAADYGFVIRYLKGKEEITKINYEPWHLRYVGIKNAEYMMKNNLVLEEYLDLLNKAGK